MRIRGRGGMKKEHPATCVYRGLEKFVGVLRLSGQVVAVSAGLFWLCVALVLLRTSPGPFEYISMDLLSSVLWVANLLLYVTMGVFLIGLITCRWKK